MDEAASASSGRSALSGELRYRAYGETHDGWGITTTTKYHFTGQRDESTIGLYFYNARWYEQALGRFVQADAVVPEPGNPQSLNRYSYVLNNPTRYIDPSGCIPCYGDPERGECSWAGTGHHRVTQHRRRQDIATFTRFTLREVRNPSLGIDDVESFAQVLGFGASFGTSAQELGNDISSVVLGAEGPGTLIGTVGAKLQETFFGRAPLPEFGDTGFHAVYQDGQNQPYHWWAYVNTSLQGGWSGTALVGIPGNFVHEFLDISESLKAPEKRGASWQDYALSYDGMAFGLALREGRISIETVGDAARFALRTDLRDPLTRQLQQIGNQWLPPNILGRGLDWLLGR